MPNVDTNTSFTDTIKSSFVLSYPPGIEGSVGLVSTRGGSTGRATYSKLELHLWYVSTKSTVSDETVCRYVKERGIKEMSVAARCQRLNHNRSRESLEIKLTDGPRSAPTYANGSRLLLMESTGWKAPPARSIAVVLNASTREQGFSPVFQCASKLQSLRATLWQYQSLCSFSMKTRWASSDLAFDQIEVIKTRRADTGSLRMHLENRRICMSLAVTLGALPVLEQFPESLSPCSRSTLQGTQGRSVLPIGAPNK